MLCLGNASVLGRSTPQGGTEFPLELARGSARTLGSCPGGLKAPLPELLALLRGCRVLATSCGPVGRAVLSGGYAGGVRPRTDPGPAARPLLQMVCGFLEKASEKLTSPESTEFTR